MPMLRSQRNITVGASSVELVPGNMARRALIIGSPALATVWISFLGPNAVGEGIPLRVNTAPLVLDKKLCADVLTDAIFAIAESGTESIGVIDLFG